MRHSTKLGIIGLTWLAAGMYYAHTPLIVVAAILITVADYIRSRENLAAGKGDVE